MTDERSRLEPFAWELRDADQALKDSVETPVDAYELWDAWQKRGRLLEGQQRANDHEHLR